ncbi:Mucin-4 [Xylographa opegraphella]|nr:Mucin-4 [Xylographa opegraphella]
MPKKISAQISGHTSTLSTLAEFLRITKEDSGQIRIHPSINTAVARIIKPGRPLPAKEVAAVVQVLDGSEPAAIGSLLGSAAGFLFAHGKYRSGSSSIDVNSIDAQQEALDEVDLETKEPQRVTSPLGNLSSLSRKACIGRQILRLCLKHFRNSLVDVGARRWTGLLALALLQDSPENIKMAVTESEENRYMIGHMVIREQNEILRYIAGAIIRQIISQGGSRDLFWSSDSSIALQTNFFEVQFDNSHWPELLKGYLDEVDSQLTGHEQKFAPLSYSLQLGRKAYSDTAPSFLVTLAGHLSIIVPELTTTYGTRKSSQYVDVPINNISRVEIQEAPVSAPTSSPESHVRSAVVVYLSKIDEHTMFVNAAARSYPFLRLVFDNRNIANTLRHLILGLQAQGKTDIDSLSVSDSLPDGSEPIDSDDQPDVSPSPVQREIPRHRMDWSIADFAETFEESEEMISMVDDGTRMGTVATAINAQIPIDTGSPSCVAASTGARRLHDVDHLSKYGIKTPESARQSGREKPRAGEVFRRHELEPTGILATQGTRSPLDTIATCSAQWRDGVNAIDNALELASQIHDTGRTASQLAQPREVGTRLKAQVKPILPMGSRQLQAVNHKHGQDPLDDTADNRKELEIVPFPTEVMGLTGAQKRKASKVSKRLLNRDGEQIESVGTDEEASRPKKYSKSRKGVSVVNNDMPAKKRASKEKTTYAATSKPANSIDRASHDVEPDDLATEGDVFAIPDSPSRISKPSAKTKHKRTVVKKTKSTKSKDVSKRARVKPVLGMAKDPVPKSASKSNRTRAPPERAVHQEDIQDSEAHTDGDDKDMLPGGEVANAVEENPLMTINNGNRSDRTSESSPNQVPENVSREFSSNTKTNERSVTKRSNRNTASASMSRQPDPAVPRRQLPKRMAAVQANQKLQSLRPNEDSIHTDGKLNDDMIAPESREHVRRIDKARRICEHSALEAGPSFSVNSQLSTVHHKATKRSKQLPKDQRMTPSKELRHGKANVDRYSSTINNPPNRLLTTSSHLSSRSVERADGHSGDLHQAQTTDTKKSLVSPVESRSPEESVDLITTCKMPHTSDEIVAQQIAQPPDFTGADNDISFSDTFNEREPEALIAEQSAQLHNPQTFSNLEAGHLSGVDQGGHPTSSSRVDFIPITTPFMIPPSVTSTSFRIPTAQSSSTNVASTGSKSTTALPEHDIPATLSQLQHVEPKTTTHSSSHARPVQDHVTTIKLEHNAQDVILDSMPMSHQVAHEKENETIPEVDLNLAKQSSKSYTTGPISEHRPTTANDDTGRSATTDGLVDATESQPARELVEISSGDEASSEEDFEIAQEWPTTDRKKERVSNKRKSDGLAGSINKKLKADKFMELPKSDDTSANSDEHPIDRGDTGVIATDDRTQRKPILIGFDSNGPRNQGISSAHKAHAEKQLSVPKAPVLTEAQSSSRKRKYSVEQQTIEFSFSQQRSKDAPIKKPRGVTTAVPPTPQAVEKPNAQFSTSIQNPTVRQLSSQRSRVQENGSPVATRSQNSRTHSIETRHLMGNTMNNEGHNISMDMESDRVMVKQGERGNDFAREVDLPRIKPLLNGIGERSSRAEKLLSSSPMVNYYYEHTDGKLVNFETEDVVQVAKISDPFSDMNQAQSNSFVERLRATGGTAKGSKKPNPEDIDFTLHDEGVKYIEPADADMTMVEPGSRRRRRSNSWSSGYSSSSHSSNSKGRNDRPGTSDSESGEHHMKAEIEWRGALKQHQRRPLNSLSEMSNRLVRQLGSKELAVGDTVSDFAEGGARLIEGINDAHAGDRKMFAENRKHAVQALGAQLVGLTLSLDCASKGVRGHRVAEMQKISTSEEEARQSQLATATRGPGN